MAPTRYRSVLLSNYNGDSVRIFHLKTEFIQASNVSSARVLLLDIINQSVISLPFLLVSINLSAASERNISLYSEHINTFQNMNTSTFLIQIIRFPKMDSECLVL